MNLFFYKRFLRSCLAFGFILYISNFGYAQEQRDPLSDPDFGIVAERFARSIINRDESFLMLRKLKDDERRELFHKGIFDMEGLIKVVISQGYAFDVFQVLASEDKVTEYLINFRRSVITSPHRGNPKGTLFIPKANSEWIFVSLTKVKLVPESLIKSDEISQIEFPDSINGVIPVGVDDLFGRDKYKIFEDLKKLSRISRKDNLELLTQSKILLQTEFGRQVLENLIKLKN